MLQNIANIIILLGAVAVAIKNINTLLQPPAKKLFKQISNLPLRKRLTYFFHYTFKEIFTSRSKKLELDMAFMKQIEFDLARYRLDELYNQYKTTQKLPREDKERITYLYSNCHLIGYYNQDLDNRVKEMLSWEIIE